MSHIDSNSVFEKLTQLTSQLKTHDYKAAEETSSALKQYFIEDTDISNTHTTHFSAILDGFDHVISAIEIARRFKVDDEENLKELDIAQSKEHIEKFSKSIRDVFVASGVDKKLISQAVSITDQLPRAMEAGIRLIDKEDADNILRQMSQFEQSQSTQPSSTLNWVAVIGLAVVILLVIRSCA